MEDKREKIKNCDISDDKNIEMLLKPKKDFHVSVDFKDRLMKEVTTATSSSSRNQDIFKGEDHVHSKWRLVTLIASVAAVVAVVVLVTMPLFKDNNWGSRNQELYSESTLSEVDSKRNDSMRDNPEEPVSEEIPVEANSLTESGLKSVSDKSRSFIADAKPVEKRVDKKTDENFNKEDNNSADLAETSEDSRSALSDESIPMTVSTLASASNSFPMTASNSFTMTVSNDFDPIPMSTVNESYYSYSEPSFNEINKGYSAINLKYPYYEEEFIESDSREYFTEEEMKKLRNIERREYVERMRLQVEMAEAFAEQIQNSIHKEI